MEYVEYADWLLRAAAGLIAAISGFTIRERRGDGAGKLMSGAAFVLLVGIVCDLLPRATGAAALWRSAGRTVWGLALTVFCVLMTLAWEKIYDVKMGYYAEMLTRDTSGIRALACIAPFIFRLASVMQGESAEIMSEWPLSLIAPGVRGLMLAIVTAVISSRWHKTREQNAPLRGVWLWMLGTAVFEIAAELDAAFHPLLEKLELPALACLSAIVLAFVRFCAEQPDI